MSRTQYKLSINTPCQENWEDMSKTENGRFCLQCSKSVFDFTNLSDKEIVQLLERSQGKICGRLNNRQLDRIIGNKDKKTLGPGFYKFLAGFLFLSGTVDASFKNKISTHILSDKSTDSDLLAPCIALLSSKDTLNTIFRGKIMDSELKEPVIGGVVMIKNTNRGVNINLNGGFEMSIPEGLREDKVTFIINSIGYISKEYTFTRAELSSEEVVMTLCPDENMLTGEVAITPYNGKSLKIRLRNFFYNTFQSRKFRG